jgi:Beta-propeller repeat
MAVPASSNLEPAIPASFKMNQNHAIKFLSTKLTGFALGLMAVAAAAQTAADYGNLPLYFEAPSPAHFLASGLDSQLSISLDEAQLALREQPDAPSRAVQMQFIGASPQARIHGDEELPGKINYFTGNNPAQWRSGVTTFAKVRIDEIYPGINLVYYGNQHLMEYDLTVAPGTSPDSIAMNFDGADEIMTNAQGELVLKLGAREIFQPRPLIYQMVEGTRKEIGGGYKMLDAHRVAFAVGKYDHALPLVIDPILSYATYFGGTLGEFATAVAVNPNDGSIYIAGQTFSKKFYTNGPSFSTPNAYQTNFGGGTLTGDAFVARFDNLGKNLIYLTYLGGSTDDGASGVAVDNAGNAFVTGFTDSTNFPTSSNALYPKISGKITDGFKSYPVDAFVTELNPGGSNLVYSTYLGGSSMDAGTGIAVDSSDNAYVIGYSFSTNFPTKNAIQNRLACKYTIYFNCNAFVSEIASNGSALVFSTYLGGTNFDQGQGIALDSDNNIYVAGFTSSTNFPTTNYVNQIIGTNLYDGHWLNGFTNKNVTFPYDAFLTRLAPSGTNITYSTLLGGVNNDQANHVAVDGTGAAYVTGWTVSTNFPNTTATNLIANRLTNNVKSLTTTNTFLTKITNGTGTSAGIAYSVTFGGSRSDIGFGVAVDPVGDAFVIGTSTSTNFPCFPTNSTGFLHATNAGGSDVFVTAFNSDASALLYSILMGGKKDDSGYGIAVDPVGNAYVVGRTISTNFATPNAFQTFLNGTNDTFLAKIVLQSQPVLAIAPSNVTNVTLAWSAFSPEFVLESNMDLASTNWVVVPQLPVPTNGSLILTLPATDDDLFFRLHMF